MSSPDVLVALKAKRVPIKAQITRLVNVISELAVDDVTCLELNDVKCKLEKLSDKFDTAQTEIDGLSFSEAEEAYRADVDSIIAKGNSHLCKLLQALSDKEAQAQQAFAERQAQAQLALAREEAEAKKAEAQAQQALAERQAQEQAEAARMTKIKQFEHLQLQFLRQMQILREFEIEDLATFNEARIRRAEFTKVFDAYRSECAQVATIDAYDCEIDFNEIESDYFKVISFFDTLIAEKKQLYDPEPAQTGSQRSSLDPVMPILPKLPEIRLPHFNGSPSQWIEFRDTFSSLIIQHKHISEMDKYQYLKSCLSSEVSSVIQNIPVSAATFQVAWQTLVDRFDNDRLIANTHLDNLFSPPQVEKYSADSLQKYLDHFVSTVHALNSLNTEVELSDLIITRIIIDKLPMNLIREWESSVKVGKLPTLKELFVFLESRVRILQMTDAATKGQVAKSVPSSSNPSKPKSSPAKSKCPCCRTAVHELFSCYEFRKMTFPQRDRFVKDRNLCRVCLQGGGHGPTCKTFRCSTCAGRHSTFLHDPASDSHQAANTAGVMAASQTQQRCLLPTATVRILDSNGSPVEATALLDSGSDCNLISNRLFKRLRLAPCKQQTTLAGILSTNMSTFKLTSIAIQSRVTVWHYNTQAIIVPEISEKRFPSSFIETKGWNIPPNLPLADPSFSRPKCVDLLLGVEICAQVICPGQISTPELPTIQNSHLGWYFAGRLPSMPSPQRHCHLSGNQRRRFPAKSHPKAHPINPAGSEVITSNYSAFLTADQLVSEQLSRFWELERVSNSAPFPEESFCEQHFTANTQRDSDGRYVVKLPFVSAPESLGSTMLQARKRFFSLEKRLSSNETLREEYSRFMDEYQKLGHMKPTSRSSPGKYEYVIPHHPVLKPSSTTTKLRVVFDASAKSSNGKSLNDLLAVGPVVQPDLFSILLRFRFNPVAFTADIEKMYRQVMVHPDHQPLQQIFWRSSTSDPIQLFDLTTVTYGTASAAFLATRALKQLSIDEGSKFPAAASVISSSIYVDDIVATAATLSEAKVVVAQLRELLPLGGFNPRKWSSNSVELLQEIPPESREPLNRRTFGDSDASSIKALGLIWQPIDDMLRIETSVDPSKPFTTCSRRTLLSCIASIFDPLGLICPIVSYCKILFQSLWKETSSWDQPIPSAVADRWRKVHNQLHSISSIAIPRLALQQNFVSVQLHGFCDASEVAYGACLYLRSVDHLGQTKACLLCAKSRVAPLKATTIPRLELLAAHLLATLVHRVLPTLQLPISSIRLWSDSKVVLGWLGHSPTKLKTFVANRVADVQEYTDIDSWSHVPSKDNPADLISRGATPSDLLNNVLWWSGPSWLTADSAQWPSAPTDLESLSLPEVKISALIRFEASSLSPWLTKFSHLKTIRVMAYVRRFINNYLKLKSPIFGPLLPSELSEALHSCIRIIQGNAFREEIQALSSSQELSSSSKIRQLCPFLQNNILRVGGRLSRSNLPFDNKHQMLLPADHAFTRQLILHVHLQLGHAGPQLLISHLRESFWIPCIRKLVRSVRRRCTVCFRFEAQAFQQKMADLPPERVSPLPPFTNTSVDYAGPFVLKFGGPRSKVSTKAYISIFVCMSTKAVHVELVTSLTSRAFLAALSRFTGRRGIPSSITSDNGTNFVGAHADLLNLSRLLTSTDHQSAVQDATAHLNIHWRFLPPHAPHMGGIHEAAVRSLKFHLKRMSSSCRYTYEEMSTILIQIESFMNSRPLTSLSEDVDDFGYLSPGHFLIGRPIVSVPSPDLSGGYNLRSRWNHLQQMVSSLWKRWSVDYLHTLQRRAKWYRALPDVPLGTPVLVIEDNVPPHRWVLGLVHQVHPGPDGLIRVVTVRTVSGTYKRPLIKLAPLPVSDEFQ